MFQRAGHLQEAAEQAALRQQQEMEERRQRHLEALVQETEEVLRGFHRNIWELGLNDLNDADLRSRLNQLTLPK